MKNISGIFFVILITGLLQAQTKSKSSFEIRGMLPWHNFLSGPTAWNLEDYQKYLDELEKRGINFIGFHNYTGGGERYATYVEPMIKIRYKNILPEAYFDNSLTSRWGYTPMKIEDFAFNTSAKFKDKSGAFGAECSIGSASKEMHYEKAQKLMRQVMEIAHKKGMKFAMGFEFGVHPPEYFSLKSDPDFYWPGQSNMIPNPANYQSVQILYSTIDNILEAYPSIDYIWLWLNEHSFMGVNLEQALNTQSFKNIYAQNKDLFTETGSDQSAKFIGVWTLTYIRLAKEYLERKGSRAGLIIGGWGGGNQLPSILKGLDRGLPKDITFSLLNPNLGKEDPPEFLSDIAKNRDVISVPWLEGDGQLWQLQPRVDLMQRHVKIAKKMNLKGVVAIHWRTEETKLNFETYAKTAENTEDKTGVREIYFNYLKENYGDKAAQELTDDLTRWDIEKWYCGNSEEYYAYVEQWGRLDENTSQKLKDLVKKLDIVIENTGDKKYLDNLNWLKSKIRFNLLLDITGRNIEPAYKLRSDYYSGRTNPEAEEIVNARKMFDLAPVKELFEVYASSVRSRGELGELSSLNQKLWREYLELKKFLNLVQ